MSRNSRWRYHRLSILILPKNGPFKICLSLSSEISLSIPQSELCFKLDFFYVHQHQNITKVCLSVDALALYDFLFKAMTSHRSQKQWEQIVQSILIVLCFFVCPPWHCLGLLVYSRLV